MCELIVKQNRGRLLYIVPLVGVGFELYNKWNVPF